MRSCLTLEKAIAEHFILYAICGYKEIKVTNSGNISIFWINAISAMRCHRKTGILAKGRCSMPLSVIITGVAFFLSFSQLNYEERMIDRLECLITNSCYLFDRPAGESGSTYTIANLLTDVSLHSSQKLKRSASGVRMLRQHETETDVDEGYDFGNETDEYDDDDVSDDEIDANIQKLVERDALSDSGYGELSIMYDHSYSKTPKRAKQSREEKSGVSMEVQALLSLANEATRQLEVIHGQKVDDKV